MTDCDAKSSTLNFRCNGEWKEGLEKEATNAGKSLTEYSIECIDRGRANNHVSITQQRYRSDDKHLWFKAIDENDLFKDDVHKAELGQQISIDIDLEELLDLDVTFYSNMAETILYTTPKALEAIENVMITDYGFSNVVFKISNYEDSLSFTNIRDLGSTDVANLVMFRGVIDSQTPIYVKEATYRVCCDGCGTDFVKIGSQLTDSFPCPTCNKVQEFVLKDAQPFGFVDTISYRIEDADTVGANRGASIICEVTTPLVDKEHQFESGVSVVVCGVYTPIKDKKDEDMVYRYRKIKVLDIYQTDRRVDLTPTEEEKAQFLVDSVLPDTLERLASVVAPDVCGFEIEKKAIVLQQFSPDDGGPRSNIHILMIGDPGVGKSKLASCVTKVVPHSKKVEGSGVTAVGMIGCVSRDEELNHDYVISAGALTLADGGLLIMEEIDKISPDVRRSIHGAMEDGVVSVDKANVHVTLKAQCCILATGNPKRARFDMSLPLLEQVDLSDTLLSRFDAIFFICQDDSPEHIRKVSSIMIDNMDGVKHETAVDPLYFKKYVKYAHDYVGGITTSPEAREMMTQEHLRIRNHPNNKDFGNITNRIHNSIMRFARAHARMRLSSVVEPVDVEAAMDIVHHYLETVCVDPKTHEPAFAATFGYGDMPSEFRLKNEIMDTVKDACLRIMNTRPEGTRMSEISLDVDRLRECHADIFGEVERTVFDHAIQKLYADGLIRLSKNTLWMVDPKVENQNLLDEEYVYVV